MVCKLHLKLLSIKWSWATKDEMQRYIWYISKVKQNKKNTDLPQLTMQLHPKKFIINLKNKLKMHLIYILPKNHSLTQLPSMCSEHLVYNVNHLTESLFIIMFTISCNLLYTEVKNRMVYGCKMVVSCSASWLCGWLTGSYGSLLLPRRG